MKAFQYPSLGRLAFLSLLNRKVTTALTIASITLSVALLLGVEKIRVGAKDGFSSTISQTDLIVGARGSTTQLLLYTVFRIGNPTNNVSYESYQHFKNHPDVAWTIPYSMGDSHRGFRVVGTTGDFYEHYRFAYDQKVTVREGRTASEVFDVVIGSTVARELNYKIGSEIVVSHGITDGPSFWNHDNKPFKVVGILNATGTPIDQSIYVTLEGIEAIHMDWTDGAPPLPKNEIPKAEIEAASRESKIEIKEITSFLVRTKTRIETLRLQREINTFDEEPLTAIIPGVALNELWVSVGYAETALLFVSVMVVVIGLVGMLIALYSSLAERRREMAVLRALGATPVVIGGLLVIESTILTILGVTLGTCLTYISVAVLKPMAQTQFGITLVLGAPTAIEFLFVGILLFCGVVLGLIPAIMAYRQSLSDGLTVRT